MHIDISIYQGGHTSTEVNRFPDECPLCHHAVSPLYVFGFGDATKLSTDKAIQAVFRCPREKCHNLFIAYYSSKHSDFSGGAGNNILHRTAPIDKLPKGFSDSIAGISPTFVSIYNEAFSAEQDGLLEICGVGYRKALEFLIKDFLIRGLTEPAEVEAIKKKFLGKCIEDDVKDDNVKQVAKRAAWLGNDETHYERKWEGKDLQDLKSLIALTVHWLEATELTKDFIQNMPEEAKQ